ncbi:MAG: HNH endonuclease [Planctomycetaceae bacterium]|nr:HNH endonuclease [Planctomycetaceae bacterium]
MLNAHAIESPHRPDPRQLKLPIEVEIADQIRVLGRKRRRRQLQKECPRCAYCDRDLKGGGTLDHVIPLSRGGRTTPDNTVLACGSCNSRKGDRTPAEWAARIMGVTSIKYLINGQYSHGRNEAGGVHDG